MRESTDRSFGKDDFYVGAGLIIDVILVGVFFACSASAEVVCHEFNGRTYCRDSQTGRETVCHTFNGRLYCKEKK